MAHTAAALLHAARTERRTLIALPESLRPRDANAAYAIQMERTRLAGAIGGWKIVLPERDAPYLPAPLCAGECLASGAIWAGPARIEVELGLRLLRDLPRRERDYRAAELVDAVAAYVVLEVLGTRFADMDTVDGLALLADGQNNAAIVIGGALADWRVGDAADLAFTLDIDGAPAARSTTGATTARVLDALAWLANHAAGVGASLRTGQMVITGARIGPVAVAPGSIAVARGSGGAAVALRIAA